MKYLIKQWRTQNGMEEMVDEFDGDVREYFEHHIKQIKEDGKYRIFTSWCGEDSFFIELDEGKEQGESNRISKTITKIN